MIVFLVETARAILNTLQNSCLTQKEIIEKSGFSERTVRNYLRILVKASVIEELNNVSDMRFKKYRLKEVE